MTGTLLFSLTVILKTLPELCFFVQLLMVMLKTLRERFFFSLLGNCYIDNITGTLFF